jgi:hypothetical protein
LTIGSAAVHNNYNLPNSSSLPNMPGTQSPQSDWNPRIE